MKILCSGEIYKEPITTEKCLECALYQGTPPCGYSYSLLKAMYAANEADIRTDEVHVSDMLGCIRKAYLDKVDPQAQYAHRYLALMIGTAVHDYIEKIAQGDPLLRVEVPVEGDGLKGRIDVYYPNEKRLSDLKTSRWINISQLPQGNHEQQVRIYAHLMDRIEMPVDQLTIQYVDLSGPSKCRRCYSKPTMEMIDGVVQCPNCGFTSEDSHLGAVQIEITKEDISEDVKQRALRLQAALNERIKPEAEIGWLCRYCTHTANCPEGDQFLNRRK